MTLVKIVSISTVWKKNPFKILLYGPRSSIRVGHRTKKLLFSSHEKSICNLLVTRKYQMGTLGCCYGTWGCCYGTIPKYKSIGECDQDLSTLLETKMTKKTNSLWPRSWKLLKSGDTFMWGLYQNVGLYWSFFAMNGFLLLRTQWYHLVLCEQIAVKFWHLV